MNNGIIISRQQIVFDFFNGRWDRIESLLKICESKCSIVQDLEFFKLIHSLTPSRLLSQSDISYSTSLVEPQINFYHRLCGVHLVRGLSAIAVNDNDEILNQLRSFFAAFQLFVAKYFSLIGEPPISIDFSVTTKLDIHLRQYALMLEKIHGSRLPSRITCVLGMHRSGTSALSGLLELSGLFGPKDSLGSTKHNPLGYWESTALVSLNDDFISRLGTHWSKLFLINKCWHLTDISQKWLRDFLEIVPTIFESNHHIVLKDPRLCILIEGLFPSFASGLIPIDYLLILRSPLEVIFSLQKSEGLDLCSGLQLWIESVFHSESLTRYLPRRILTYSSLLDSPEKIISSCNELWGFQSPNTHTTDLRQFVDSRYRHQKASNLLSIFESNHRDLMPYLELADFMYKLMASSDSTDSHARMNDLRDHWNVSLSSMRS